MESESEPAGREATIVSLPGFFRIAGMLEELRDEIRRPVLDDAARERLRQALDVAVEELRTALSPDLVEEFGRLRSRLAGPHLSTDELRVGYAELVGWLHGVLGLARVSVDIPAAPDGAESPGSPGRGASPAG